MLHPTHGGTGLGLAIARSVVERHGGQLTATSRLGEGSTFRVFLPSAFERTPDAGGSPDGTGAERCTGKGPVRVSLMDDSYVRYATERALVALGHEGVSVGDGADAVERHAAAEAFGEPFELVILDLRALGGTGGLETLTQLRQACPEVLAIAVSGYASEDVLVRPGAHGFAAALREPFAQAELRGAIEAGLSTRDGREKAAEDRSGDRSELGSATSPSGEKK